MHQFKILKLNYFLYIFIFHWEIMIWFSRTASDQNWFTLKIESCSRTSQMRLADKDFQWVFETCYAIKIYCKVISAAERLKQINENDVFYARKEFVAGNSFALITFFQKSTSFLHTGITICVNHTMHISAQLLSLKHAKHAIHAKVRYVLLLHGP